MLKYRFYKNVRKSQEIQIILNLLLQRLYLIQFLPGKLTFFDRVLKTIACVALVRKAADEIIIEIFFFKFFGVLKINELVVTSNKLTNNFADLFTSGLGRMWPAGRQLDHTSIGHTVVSNESIIVNDKLGGMWTDTVEICFQGTMPGGCE
jgi:hypothetical protein